MDRVTDPALESGDTVADRYVLDAPAESDLSHAWAWSGQDEILQRRVQVTVLGGAHREEALDTARRASLVRDDRLQRILRVGNYEDTAYIVTEPVTGVPLSTLVEAGPLPPAQARALVGHAAAALETARKRGVHHLRLSPRSVQLMRDGSVVVTGLAVAAAQAGIPLPDARSAARADAVSLVELLYTALTGMWPGDRVLADGLPLAPRSGRAPEPPADVTEGVPHDLDTLCAVSFGPHQDGPYTPGELVRELQPWDQLDPPAIPDAPPQEYDGGARPDTVGVTGSVAGTAVLPTPGRGVPTGAGNAGADAPGEAAPADQGNQPPAADQSDPAAETTISSSLARRLSGSSLAQRLGGMTRHNPDATAPATPPPPAPPPPAPPPAGAATPAAPPTPQAEPAAAPLPPAAPERPVPPAQGWDLPASSTAVTPSEPDGPGRSLGGDLSTAAEKVAAGAGRMAAGARGLLERVRPEEDEEEEPVLPPGSESGNDDTERSRFNPTPWVIFAMVAILVIALILALGSLRDAGRSFVPAGESSEPEATQTEEPTAEETTEEPSEEPSESPEAVDISFTEARSLDPSTGSGDNPDLADQAIDGDADTIWRSLRYDNPTYGMKPGLGFAVELEEPSTVTTVTVDVQGEGGTVQIRNTSPDDPSSGEVLAEGAMGPDTTYTLSSPTELEAIVLWFPELPEAASDGRNRIELAEITAN